MKNKIQHLINAGLSKKLLTNLSEGQVNQLHKRMVSEQPQSGITMVPAGDTAKQTQLKQQKKTYQVYEKEIDEDDTLDVVKDPDATEDGMGIFEKFESKSQQRLFYARCGNGKTKTEKKWCKWAKEFSKETDYETTPEKKEKNESDEKLIDESIVRLIEKNISPRMSKGDLIRTINEKSQESSMILRNPLKNTMFSKESGIEMKRMKRPTMGMPIMGTMEENTKEREAPVKDPGVKTPPKRRDNPFKNPNPGTKEKPRGQKKSKDEMKTDFIGLIKQALTK